MREQLEMLQRKFGYDKPMITPIPPGEKALSGAMEGFKRAVSNKSVQSVEIGVNRTVDRGDYQVHTYSAMITFTRYGEQEFANGDCAWWDTLR